MAEDKTQNMDDWDNLPLDPEASDDWDDIPPPPPAGQAPAADKTARPEPDPPAPEDDFEAAVQAAVNEPEPEPAPAPEEPEEAPQEDELEEAAPEAPAASAPEADEDDLDDDFEVVENEAPPAATDQDATEIPMPNPIPPNVPTKKVELDIEGIAFKEDKAREEEEGEEEEDEEEEEAGPVPVAAAPKAPAPAAAPEEPPQKRRSKRKLLLALLLLLLLLGGAGFGVYTFFLAAPKAPPPPPPPPISTELPYRDPDPGELRLDSFYISFPGRNADTVIELSTVLYHNEDTDELLIMENMNAIRDIIYRVTQGKGSLMITDNELQRALREELRERINLLLGGDRVSYVQITQIRILQ